MPYEPPLEPGITRSFYDDPLTELVFFGIGTLVERLSYDAGGLETWIADFTVIVGTEDQVQRLPRQVKSPDVDPLDEVVNDVETIQNPPVPVDIEFAAIKNKPTTVAGYGITDVLATGISAAPATSSSPGALGEVRFTSSGIYICIATNMWIRALASTW